MLSFKRGSKGNSVAKILRGILDDVVLRVVPGLDSYFSLWIKKIIDRPGVAGAVLQTASSFTEQLILFLKYLHNIINHKR